MASVISDPNGTRRIQWCVGKRERRTLRLGAVSQKQAEAVKVRIEQVLASRATGVLDHQAEEWLVGLNEEMHEKLARLGLVKPRKATAKTLGGLLDEYFANLSVKPGTRRTYEQTRTSLIEFFGECHLLADITPLESDRWVTSMRASGLADATVAKRIKTAKQVFGAALRWKLVRESPFALVRSGVTTNRARMRFISPADIAKVLDACPDAEWRMIVRLSRYGGLRCPSEIYALKWSDVDFHKDRFVVRSCKTEHIDGKDRREVPLFPELKTAMLEAFEAAKPGSEYVIATHRLASGNLRTQMLRYVERAGLTPWPRLFHNLRSSRETELCEHFPIQVVCSWLGNSPNVALRHYLQTTDEHYRRAAQSPTADKPATGGLATPGTVGAAQAPGPNAGQPRANGANVAA